MHCLLLNAGDVCHGFQLVMDYLRPLEPHNELRVHPIKDGWSIVIRTSPVDSVLERNRSTHLDINLLGDVFYLLGIQLRWELRGQGHGTRLYELCEEAARAFHCRQIRQTPSGTTPNGDSRESYLVRRGWQVEAGECYKDLT